MLLSHRDAARLAQRDVPVAPAPRPSPSRLASSRTPQRPAAEHAVRFCSRDLFPMFELPFRYGRRVERRRRAPARSRWSCSTTRATRLFFGGGNSVGRSAPRSTAASSAWSACSPLAPGAASHTTSRSRPRRRFISRSSCSCRSVRGQTTSPAARSTAASIGELVRSDDAFVQLWVELDSAVQRVPLRGASSPPTPGKRHGAQRSSAARRAGGALGCVERCRCRRGFLVFEVCAFIALLALQRESVAPADREVPGPRARARAAACARRHARERDRAAHARGRAGRAARHRARPVDRRRQPGRHQRDRPRSAGDFALDLQGVLLACAMGLGAGLLAGIHPAVRMCQAAPATFLRSSLMMRVGLSPIASSMRHRKSAYASLVLEVALGCTVVAYRARARQGPARGGRSSRSASMPAARSRSRSRRRRAARTSSATRASSPQLRALPGVEEAAWVELPPLSRCELPETLMAAGGPRLTCVVCAATSTCRACSAPSWRSAASFTAEDGAQTCAGCRS